VTDFLDHSVLAELNKCALFSAQRLNSVNLSGLNETQRRLQGRWSMAAKAGDECLRQETALWTAV